MMNRNISLTFALKKQFVVKLTASECVGSTVISRMIKKSTVSGVSIKTSCSTEICLLIVSILKNEITVSQVDDKDVLSVLKLATSLEMNSVCLELLSRMKPETEFIVDDEFEKFVGHLNVQQISP